MAAGWKVLRTAALTLFGAAALAAAAIAWRLSEGPIDLSFLNSRIEEQLSAIAPGIAAHVERTEIAWLHHLPEIRVVGAEARRGGTVLLLLPELSIRPSLRALAHATFAVERVNVAGVELSLSRERDGGILLGTANHPTQTPIDPSALLPAPSSGGDARYFKRIRVRDSTLRFEDLGSATRWAIEGIQLNVSREVDGFEGVLDARVALDSPKTAEIHGFELPISVSARLQLGEDGSLGDVAFQAQGKDGKVSPAGDPGPALPLRSLLVEGRFSKETRRMALDKLAAAVGSAEVDSSASFSAVGLPHGLELQGGLKSLPVSELMRLWPRGAAVGAREWIAANIHDGSVPSGRFVIRLPPAEVKPLPIAADAVDVKFEFTGLGVHYFGELDPLREARGSGTLSADRFEGRVSKGQVGALEMQKGRVTIDWGGPVAKLEVQADVAGPSAAALALVDRPPLLIAQKIGVAPQDLGGSSQSHVEVSLPLKGDLHSGDVHVAVDGTLADASLAKLVGDVGFSGGGLAVKVRDGNVDVEGEAKFTGLPVPVEPAHAKVSFEPTPNGSESRLQIDVAGEDLTAKATASLAAGAVAKLTIAELRLAGSELAGVITTEGGSYRAALQATTFDLRPFVEARVSDRGLGTMQVPYAADFKIERLYTRLGVDLTNVTGHMSGDSGFIRVLRAYGDVVDGGPARIEVGPHGGKQQLRVRSERPGPLLKALGFEEAAYQGGRLSLVIDLVDGGLGRSFDGRVYMRDLKVTRAPLLAKILSVGSLNGIANMLNGEGLQFSRARIPFHWSETTIELHDALAVGAIGLTAAGSIDRANRRVDLRGRVIPAYTLNSALGKVPFIGSYLVGGEGEGVFGIDYSAKGSLEKPEVSVNPLSALAPGVLRKMFIDPFKRDDSEPSPPESDGQGSGP